MKLIITGIGGFVAYHFIEYLKSIQSNLEILGLDIADNIEINYSKFNYKKIDLRNYNEVFEILSEYKPDYILHLASISSVSKSWTMPLDSFINNTNIFLNIVESIRQLKLSTRILSIGSSEEYGKYSANQMPLKETDELHPANPYAIARVSQEMLSKLYADEYGLNIVMTRSFNHIGIKQKSTFVVASFVEQLINIKTNKQTSIKVGNIEIIRDFLDVRDVVEVYYKLLKFGKKGEIYNVCSNRGIKLLDIIKIISDILNIKPIIEIDKSRIRPDDNMIIIGDNSKIKKEFGFTPKYLITESLKEIVNEKIEYINEREQI